MEKTKRCATSCKQAERDHGAMELTSNLSGAEPTRSDAVEVPTVPLGDNFAANPQAPCHCVSGPAHCSSAPSKLQSIAAIAQDP